MCQWNASQHRRRRGTATSNHGQQTVESLKEEESRVSMILSKRLRNARKRLGKIREIQRKQARGEELNEDQRVALGHAVGQELLVEELEKMSLLVADAVKEEHEENVVKQEKAVREVRSQQQKSMDRAMESLKKDHTRMVEEARQEGMVHGVERVIELLYLSGVFDPFIPYQMEKNAVLLSMKDEHLVEGHSIGEMLDMIGVLGKMMTSRPLGEVKSHQEAIRQCQDVALTYSMGNAENVLGWNGCMTKEQVENVMDKVKNLDWFTAPGEAFSVDQHGDAAYYGVPQEMNSVVAPPPPPPPPPPVAAPMVQHVSGYISPRQAAMSGENVLSQFFANQDFVSNANQPAMVDDSESLGLQEVSTVEGSERHVLVSKNNIVQNQGETNASKTKKKWRKGRKTAAKAAPGEQGAGHNMKHHASKKHTKRGDKTNIKTT